MLRCMRLCAATILVVGAINSARSQEDHSAEPVRFEVQSSLMSKPLVLRAYLRKPQGNGPFPAVVLLHGCGGDWADVDQRWGIPLVSWGYVALSVDSYGPRHVPHSCQVPDLGPADRAIDAYGALEFLSHRPFVDSTRVALMGFSAGARIVLWDVEQGFFERASVRKFRAAIAFYPLCRLSTGKMTLPTLILIGELDDWTPAEECRAMVAGRSDWLMSRNPGDANLVQLIVYPGTFHAFDKPIYAHGQSVFGHWLKYNEGAVRDARQQIRVFLTQTLAPTD